MENGRNKEEVASPTSPGASDENSPRHGTSKVPGIRELMEACGGELTLENGDRIVHHEDYGLRVERHYERSHGGFEWLVFYAFGETAESHIATLLSAYHAKYVTPLEGERDRLRAALEKIAAPTFHGSYSYAYTECKEIARSALTEGEAVS